MQRPAISLSQRELPGKIRRLAKGNARLIRRRCVTVHVAEVLEKLVDVLGGIAPTGTARRRRASPTTKGPALTLPPHQPTQGNVLVTAAANDHALAAAGPRDVGSGRGSESTSSMLGAVAGQVLILKQQRVGGTTAPKLEQAYPIQLNLDVARTRGTTGRRFTTLRKRELRRPMTRLVIEKPLKDAGTCVPTTQRTNRSAQPSAAQACSPLILMK